MTKYIARLTWYNSSVWYLLMTFYPNIFKGFILIFVNHKLDNPYTRVQSDIINCKIDNPYTRVQPSDIINCKIDNPYTRVQSDIINCKIDQPDIRVQSNVL
jgi:hypothetical protein